MADCRSSLVTSMPGLSQVASACLWEAGPAGGAPKLADHNVMYESTSGSSGWHHYLLLSVVCMPIARNVSMKSISLRVNIWQSILQ